jgi:hypothetical protein
VFDQLQPQAGLLALAAHRRVGQPDRRHQVALREHRQDARVDLVGLARQRRQTLDPLRVGDQHIPALALERVMDETRAGHRLDHPAHRLAALQHPPRQPANTIVVARHCELLDQLALPGQQTNIEPLTTQIQSSPQHQDGPPWRFVERLSIREIARRSGHDRKTVQRAIRSDAPPRYVRAPRGSMLDPFKYEIEWLLRRDPRLPGTRVRELLCELGYAGGKTILDDYLREVRPRYLPRPRTFQRTVYRPGRSCRSTCSRSGGRCRWDTPDAQGVGGADDARLLAGAGGRARVLEAAARPAVGDLPLAFGALFGVVGAIIGVPIAAWLQILVEELTAARRARVAAADLAEQQQPA